jgi:hypothetical protein
MWKMSLTPYRDPLGGGGLSKSNFNNFLNRKNAAPDRFRFSVDNVILIIFPVRCGPIRI